jgi:DNA-binding response OmpR family regulator
MSPRTLAPDAALVSLDLPWADPLELAAELRAQPHPVPVLLIGASGDGLPVIEPDADPDRLRARVGELISANRRSASDEHEPLIAQTGASANLQTPRFSWPV